MRARVLFPWLAIAANALACVSASSVVELTTAVAKSAQPGGQAQPSQLRHAATSRSRRVVKDRYKLDAPFDKIADAAAESLAKKHVRERRRSGSRCILQIEDDDGELRDAIALELKDVDGVTLEVRQIITVAASHEDKEILARLADDVAKLPGVGARIPSGSDRDALTPAPSAPPSPAPSAAPPASASAAPSQSPPNKQKPPKKPTR